MPDFPNTTRAQTIFLRALLKNPHNLPPEKQPSPILLSRWMQHRGFRKALSRVQNALRIQADLHLARATTHAAHQLNDSLLANSTPDPRTLLSTLRLSHLRRQARELNDFRTGRHKKNSFPYVDPTLYARLVKAQSAPRDSANISSPLQNRLPSQSTPSASSPHNQLTSQPRPLIGRPGM